jgi:hypothetical protein
LGVAGGHRRRPLWIALEYHDRIKLLAGTVKEGKVVLTDASLPEGTMVAVYATEPGGPVRLPANLQAELEEAIAEADREEGISAEELFARLEKYR